MLSSHFWLQKHFNAKRKGQWSQSYIEVATLKALEGICQKYSDFYNQIPTQFYIQLRPLLLANLLQPNTPQFRKCHLTLLRSQS